MARSTQPGPAADSVPDPAGPTPVRAYVGVGANLGDATAAVRDALTALDRLPGTRVAAASSLYRTAPVDAIGPDFVNAVAALDTTLTAEDLLQALHGLERDQGRQRPYRNAPRTLDLDLLLWGERCCGDPALTLPHPRMHLRAFVLEPLAELAPALVVPGLGPLAAWRARAADQAIARIAGGAEAS